MCKKIAGWGTKNQKKVLGFVYSINEKYFRFNGLLNSHPKSLDPMISDKSGILIFIG